MYLFVIDDCSAQKDINTKRKMLSFLAFSGRHYNQTIWIISQKYNSISKDVRENIKFLYLFACKDRDSFADCLRENDAIESLEERNEIRGILKSTKHAKLILKTEEPMDYCLHF